MNLRELTVENPLGIDAKAINEMEVDISRLVVDDEFNKVARDVKDDYRVRAIKRLVASGIPFHSEYNIIHDMARMFVKVSCPYCNSNMSTHNSSMIGKKFTAHYVCPSCSSEAHISMPINGISFKKQ